MTSQISRADALLSYMREWAASEHRAFRFTIF